MNPIKRLFALCFFALPFYSLAWGMQGHRIVGLIADGYLTAKARTEIQKILGTESIAMSSNWADFIKSDTSMKYLNPWHYINFKSGMTDIEIRNYLKTDTATDVYTKVNMIVKELKKKTLPLERKQFYLKLLIHFVGDIHQPLHAGRPDDLGGNRIKVQWFSNNTNLHSVWDESLVNFQQLSYTEHAAAINHATPKQRQTWQKATLADWIVESYRLAEGIYAGANDGDRLGYEYIYKNLKTVNDQLLKGGVRLAGLLNSIFG